MGTTKNKRPKKHNVPRRTAITDLPETLIPHITSSLSLQDLARIAVCTKTWRHLCYTTPYLNLDIDCMASNTTFPQYVDFIMRLFMVGLDLQLERLTITCTRELLRSYYIESFILKAIKCNVEQLDLDINPCLDSFVLPSQIFTLSSLKALKLRIPNVKMPTRVCLKNLQTLSLIYVNLPYETFGSWISTDQCPSLETLIMVDCGGCDRLDIVSSSLTTLNSVRYHCSDVLHLNIRCDRLKILSINLGLVNPSFDSFCKLYAPNLDSFTWIGLVMSFDWQCPLKSLVAASITFPPPMYGLDDNWNVKVGMLLDINHAKHFELCHASVQILAWLMMDDVLSSVSLPYVEHLKLPAQLNSNNESSQIISLLSKAPNVRTLVINQAKYDLVTLPLEPLARDLVSEGKLVHHLTIVEMRLFGYMEYTFELVMDLVRNGRTLEKIDILFSASEHEKARTFSKKLREWQRTSSSLVPINFIPD